MRMRMIRITPRISYLFIKSPRPYFLHYLLNPRISLILLNKILQTFATSHSYLFSNARLAGHNSFIIKEPYPVTHRFFITY